MALTPEEQRELDELELAELEAIEASADSGPAPSVPMSAIEIPTPWGGTFNPVDAAQTVKNMGLEAGGAAAGQVLGAGTGPLAPVAVPALGGAGSFLGNVTGQLTTPGKKFSWPEAAGAFVAGTVPGASLAKAGGKELLKAGAKSAAMNYTAKATETVLGRGELPSAGESVMAIGSGLAAPAVSKAANKFLPESVPAARPIDPHLAKRDFVLKKWRSAGGKIDPGAVDKGIPVVDMIAGKEGTRQMASVDNQRVINRLLREDLGLKGDGALGVKTLDLVREEAGIVYQRVANLSKQAASDLDNLGKARSNARELGEAYKQTNGNTELRDKWIAAKELAQGIEDMVEQHAIKSGRPQLIKELKKARETIAKSYDIEAALNNGNDWVDAGAIASSYNGRNMTGNLQLVAEAASAFPQYLVEPSRIGAPGVSRLGVYSGAQALATGSPAGAAAFTLPLFGKPARRYILGKEVQDRVAGVNQTAKQAEKVAAAMARIGLMSAGRQSNPFLPVGDTMAPAQ